MRIVWVDVCFAVNFAADYLLCLLAARLCSVPLARGRYALAALFGAFWAVAAAARGALFRAPGGKLLAAAALCLIAYGGRREFARLCAAFLALGAALGGGLWALTLCSDGAALPPAALGAAFLLFWALAGLYLRGCAAARERETASVELVFLGRSARFRALVDTGNTLCDPISGAHVMVVAPSALRGVFADQAALFSLEEPLDILSCADAQEALRGKLRLVPYAAVGARGFLVAFRPERLLVDERERCDLLVALSPSALGEGFEAIL